MIDNELRLILKEWVGYMEDLVKLPWIDIDDRNRIGRQVKAVRDKYLPEAREESEWEVWRRMIGRISEGKSVDMVDVHRINMFMDMRRAEDDSKGSVGADVGGEPDGRPVPPAVPRRDQ